MKRLVVLAGACLGAALLFPGLAQAQYELACPPGSTPLSAQGESLDPMTGMLRAFLCRNLTNGYVNFTDQLHSIIFADQFPTLQAAVTQAQNAGGARIIVPPGTYPVSTNLFAAVTVPVELDFAGPAVVQDSHGQVISTSNIKIKFPSSNPNNNNLSERPGVRWQASTKLSAPLFQINGPIDGFDLDSVHFDCNGNATYAVLADRMNNSHWSGTISSSGCTTMGFRWVINGGVADQGNAWNVIDELWVWGAYSSQQCVEVDTNAAQNADFDLNSIGAINCGGLAGSGGVKAGVLLSGADGNVIGQINCYPYAGGAGAPKACVEFGGAFAYENVIELIDSSLHNVPVVAADSGNAYPNVVKKIHLGNYLSAGGSLGKEVTGTGLLEWSGLGMNTNFAQFYGTNSPITSTPPEKPPVATGWRFCTSGGTCVGEAASTYVQQLTNGTWFSLIPDNTGPLNNATAVVPDGGATFSVRSDIGLMFQKPQAFAKLPACSSSLEGQRAAVTNSTTSAFGARISGGGANHVAAYCNGTNWVVD